MPEFSFTELVAGFGHALHASGLPVTPERSVRFGSVVALSDPHTVDELYWLGRITLITGPQEFEIYDRVFDRVFRGVMPFSDTFPQQSNVAKESSKGDEGPTGDADGVSMTPGGPSATSATPGDQVDAEDEEQDEEQDSSMLAAMSAQERLADRDFATCSEEELELIRQLAEELPVVPPMRVARRARRHASGRQLDVRGTLRRAHRTAGDPVRLVTRKRTDRPRRIVLIADVSGSMEPYARVYLHLLRGAVRAVKAEAFVFATRLTRLTRQLSGFDPDVAYGKAIAEAPDWSGGTRIGRALMDFIDGYGRRGLARGAVVVIVSDGWEVEDPRLVGVAMQRLSRLAHHVIWVNPRKATTGYEPLVGGMAAALPFVDTFISGHSVNSLREVMEAIHRAGAPSGFSLAS